MTQHWNPDAAFPLCFSQFETFPFIRCCPFRLQTLIAQTRSLGFSLLGATQPFLGVDKQSLMFFYPPSLKIQFLGTIFQIYRSFRTSQSRTSFSLSHQLLVAETSEEAKSQGQALSGGDTKKGSDFPILEHLWKKNHSFFLHVLPLIHVEHGPVVPVSICWMQNPHSKATSWR